ncbi:MAG: TonB-dependent receptor [Caulobacteraceae bacterium]
MSKRRSALLGLGALAICTGVAHAQAPDAQSPSPSDVQSGAPSDKPATTTPSPKKRKSTTVAAVNVTASKHDDTPAKLDHILPEVAGTKITVTKKTNTTKLDQQPTVIGDDLQQLFVHSPGVLVSEQQTPSQYNLSYRGLGNPQASQYVLVLQDGLPITADWIGAPTLNYLPLPQGVSEVEELRGGAGLIYGPQAEPAINFVSKRPKPGEPLTGYTEQVGGSDGLYSTYNVLEGTDGPFEFRTSFGYVHSDGERQNAQSDLRQGDLYLGYRPDGHQLWALDLHAYDARAGDPGRISYAQFKSDPSASPTPFNEDWASRYSAVLTHERDFGDGWRFEGKVFAAYEDLASRDAANEIAGAPPPTTTTLQDELYRSEGADLRLRKRYGRGDALTVGVDIYHDDSPLRQWTGDDLTAPRDDHDGAARLREARSSNYESIFAENVWRLPDRFHLTSSVRLDHEAVSVDEQLLPPTIVRAPQNADLNRDVPLFGIGVGNDFGRQNETYFSVTQGWRPLGFLDASSPFTNVQPRNLADPSKSVTYEGGVHGTPLTGLFYDADLFWIEQDNRIETIALNNVDTAEQNSGDTRNRGFEGEISYDFLAARPDGRHLTPFASLQLLDARFTRSDIPGQVGKTPAFAPHALGKYGVTWRQDHRYSVSLTGVSVSSQFFQDSDQAANTLTGFVPAKIPGYTVLDLSGDWYLTPKLRLLGGVSNLGDVRYYSRVYQNGIEPAPGRTVYGGVAVGF